jgi:hypothetical protein
LSAATPPAAMQSAGLALSAICDSFRHSHPWCHQCSSALVSSVISRDTDLSHRGNGLAVQIFVTLRIFLFSSPVDSSHLCVPKLALWLGTQLRLGSRTPCASERACYLSLGLQIYLLAGDAQRWLIVATPWLPPLVPSLPHAHRTARLAARSGAVFSPHPPNPQSIHLRTYSLRVTARIDLATSDTWSRLVFFHHQQLCSARLIGCTSAYWRGFGL